MEEETTNKEMEEEEESDTDVGSHLDLDDDVSFSFETMGGGESGNSNNGDTMARGKSDECDIGDGSPPAVSVSRVGAKVRRLDLSAGSKEEDDDVDCKMDVKKSLAATQRQRREGIVLFNDDDAGLFSSDEGGGSEGKRSPITLAVGLFDDNSSSGIHGKRSSSSSFELSSPPPSSPSDKGHNMPICPPSTARKGKGGSRLFACNNDNDDIVVEEERQDDVSPRDAMDFPFFASSPTKTTGGKGDGRFVGTVGKGADDRRTRSPRPQCPPSTARRGHMPNRSGRMIDVTNDTRLASEAHRGLRSLGRANSFLQMFSQDSIPEGGGIMDESCDEKVEEEENFIRRKFSRQDSVDRSHVIQVARSAPSPKRPMRSHHRRGRFAPASPVKEDDSASGSSSSSFSRFLSDFEIVGTLGTGTFGSVYSVRNRTDRRLYAIKAAKREARGAADRDRMLQEVYALAALSDKGSCLGALYVVRYHQAWMEGRRLYIQTELCERTLSDEMRRQHEGGEGVLMGEKRRYKLLREMLLALDLVHKSGMIHLDIKPENIFIKDDQYKLGDFGLVSKIENHEDVEEGDSRYMSMELLSGDLEDLTKSDIFSLGATMYEICLGRSQDLPSDGQEWQDMRSGILLPMTNTPFDLQMIVREMMAPEWRTRPSAEELLKKRQLLSEAEKQLIVERNRAEAANMALDAQMQRFKLMSPKNGGRPTFHRSNTIC